MRDKWKRPMHSPWGDIVEQRRLPNGVTVVRASSRRVGVIVDAEEARRAIIPPALGKEIPWAPFVCFTGDYYKDPAYRREIDRMLAAVEHVPRLEDPEGRNGSGFTPRYLKEWCNQDFSQGPVEIPVEHTQEIEGEWEWVEED